VAYDAAQTTELIVQLQKGLTLNGRVVDEQGRPVPGVELMLLPDAPDVVGRVGGTSGADGQFHLEQLADATYELYVMGRSKADAGPDEPYMVVHGGDADVRVVVPQKARVRGVVKRDGAAVSHLVVNGHAIATAAGRFSYELPPEEGPQLSLMGDFAPITLTASNHPGVETDLGTIRVEPLGAIEGHIGNAPGEGQIFIGPASPSPEIAGSYANVDEQGHFSVSMRAPGQYIAAVNTSRGEIVREFDVHAGRTTTVEIALPRGVRLEEPARRKSPADPVLEAAFQ
jgi:hypothetical protein